VGGVYGSGYPGLVRSRAMSPPAETFLTTMIPLEIRLPPSQLRHVADTPLFDVFGAYEQHADGFLIPRGVKIVTSRPFDTLEEAETFAKEFSMTWAAIMCFTMGVKVSPPRVECVLQRMDSGGRYRLRIYSYDTMVMSANLPLDTELLTRIHERMGALSGMSAERVALAVRWYTVGLGQSDDLNRFLSHWIGLEAIGDLLHNKIHKFDRAACQVCKHPAGVDRDGKKAGMQHAIAVVSGRADLFTELDNARNMLFHGLEEIQKHRRTIVSNVAALETALARGVLAILKPDGSAEAESACEPLRTASPSPHAMFEGTFLNLTDEERRLILYRNVIRVVSKVESGKNDDDGGLRLNVKLGVSVPEMLDSRLVDRRLTPFKMPGVEDIGQSS